MKKFLPFFSALVLILNSCSSDDSKESSVFVKKIIEVDKNGTSYTTDFTYDGTKKNRETVTNNETKEVYYMDYSYYSDGLISSVLKSNTKGYPLILTELTYNGDFLKTVLVTEFAGTKKIIKKTYYAAVLTNSYTYKTVDVDENNNAESNAIIGKLSIEDGKIVKDEATGFKTSTTLYEYDSNNNPFKNVKGVNSLLGNFDLGYSTYNVIKQTATSSVSNSPVIYSTTYTYNGKNFPTEAKQFDKDGNVESSTQYFY
ncbi:hypothetical protein [Flavobacterium sp. LC2016-01]|uniref:hypothetical protein n=1 Tax=Flavobacterium sp. LC2016-01 TaxID=2675876 RepID=UPI0012BAFC27|nr:hypothetical protein [Flavobacterium sp. LC2016-01]MTH16427.1 hypothetical protein [Flavobacterium sp. LC2016-01]